MFDGEHLKNFKQFTDEAVAEANYIHGYGRYLKKHRANSGDSIYESFLADGLELVKTAHSIRQAMYSILKEIPERMAKYNSDLEIVGLDKYDELVREYNRDFTNLKKRFVWEAWRIVELRMPLQEILKNLELPERRKYERREKVEKVLTREDYERYNEEEDINE